MDSPWPWLCVALLHGLRVLFTFNGLVNLRNQVRMAPPTIGVPLKQSHDLVPNLAETVKGHAAHKREVLVEEVSAARNLAARPGVGWATREHLQHAVGRLVARAVLEKIRPVIGRVEDVRRMALERHVRAVRRSLTVGDPVWRSA